MNIENLASEIKEISLEIIKDDLSILVVKKEIEFLKKEIEIEKLEIEKEIVFSGEFKNENQRTIAIKEGVKNNEKIKNYSLSIDSKEEFIQEFEFKVKENKIKKNYLETMLKLEFLKLEKGI